MHITFDATAREGIVLSQHNKEEPGSLFSHRGQSQRVESEFSRLLAPNLEKRVNSNLSAGLERISDIRCSRSDEDRFRFSSEEEKEIGRLLPRMTAEQLHCIGVVPVDHLLTNDAAAKEQAEKSYKEGRAQISRAENFYKVRSVRGHLEPFYDGELVFLKAQAGPTSLYDSDDPYTKFDILRYLRNCQFEVAAADLAQVVNYPAPPALSVIFEDSPWVASKFYPDYREPWTEVSGLTDMQRELPDRSALYTRWMFNVLAGSDGDNAKQAIVTADRQYRAIDLFCGSDVLLDESSFHEKVGRLTGSGGHTTYGFVFPKTKEVTAAYDTFIQKLEVLTPDKIEPIFSGLLAGPREIEKFCIGTMQRASVLKNAWVREK